MGKLKIPKCGKCRYFCRDKNYLYQGVCAKDDEVTRESRVCNKFENDREIRLAKELT